MKILCAALGIACSVIQPHVPPYRDATIGVVCPADQKINAGLVIDGALEQASELWWTTAPQSDAAAWSTEGATIAVELYSQTCYLQTPIHLVGNTWIENGVFIMTGDGP